MTQEPQVNSTQQKGILRRGNTFMGKLWRGVARGLVDGIPVVGVAVTAIESAAKGETVRPTARVVSSAFSILVVIYLALERLNGNVSVEEVIRVLSLVMF